MSINTAKTILGGLLPFAANPVVLTVIGIGAASWAIASLFEDDEETEINGTNNDSNRSEPHNQPLEQNVSTVQTAVQEPLDRVEATVDPAVELTVEQVPDNGGEPHSSFEIMPREDHLPETMTDDFPHDEEATKKELIRLAMSELGKRSGEARRQKSQTKFGRQ